MNSFSAMQRAIDYEIARQSELLEAGRDGEIVLETRLWEEGAQRTVSGGATFGQHTLSFGTGCEVSHSSVGRKQPEEPDLAFASILASRAMPLLDPAMVSPLLWWHQARWCLVTPSSGVGRFLEGQSWVQ
jgi:hypothetical protein